MPAREREAVAAGTVRHTDGEGRYGAREPRQQQGMFRVGIPALGIAVCRGTEDVPDDGRYHVVVDGQIVASERSQKRALGIYRERRDQLIADGAELPAPEPPIDPAERLRQERVDRDIRSMRSEWLSRLHRKSRKGGKGGRGGV